MSNTAHENSPAERPVPSRLTSVRQAQRAWSQVPLNERLEVIARARAALAAQADRFAELSASSRSRPVAEALSAEVLPLLEAHRFLEREGSDLLARRELRSRSRPLWLSTVQAEILREPRGIVLVVGPGNYPLFLPGVQILQALVAGNGVIFKPAPGTSELAAAFRDLWITSGLPRDLLQILSEEPSTVHEVIREGVDFVVVTGSAAVGEAILKTCAEKLTPSVMELSGCDPVIVCDDADLEITAGALGFGLRINAGATCIAPRRVYAARRIAERLEAHLTKQLSNLASLTAPARLVEACEALLTDAEQRNATIIAGGLRDGRIMLPLVISGGQETRALLGEELFAPVLLITFVDSDEEAIALAGRSAYALGATVFSRDESRARRIAENLQAGVVSINDIIVPASDPRLPFGGRSRSGFGVTRGAEGLLTMTVPKVITRSKGRHRPHYQPVGENEARLFTSYITTTHAGSWKQRWAGVRDLWSAIRNFSRAKRQKHSHDLPHEQ